MTIAIKRAGAALVVAGATAAILGAATQVQAASTLRWSNYLPGKHPLLNRVFKPWMKEVQKVTGGRVKFQYQVAPYGPPPRQYDLVADGVAHATFALNGFTPGRFPLTGIAELPFLSESAEALSVAYWRTYQKFLAKAGEYKGTELMAVSTHGPGNIWGTKTQYTSVADMQGKKFMVWGGTINKVASLIGAVPVFVPVPKGYETLSSGVVDGFLVNIDAPWKFKLTKFLRHRTHVPGGVYNSTFYIVVNQKAWAAISKKDQEAIRGVSGEKLTRAMGKIWDLGDKLAKAFYDKDGVKSITASPEFVTHLKEKLGVLEQEWIAAAKAKGVDGAAALAYLRAEEAKEAKAMMKK